MSARCVPPDDAARTPGDRWVPVLVRLYPGAWRARYGPELTDLLGGRPLTVRQGWDLVRGALDAHGNLHDLMGRCSVMVSRLRSAAVTTFTAWVVFCVATGAWSKATEDPAFAQAAAGHPALKVTYGLARGAFVVALVAVLVGGLPLAWVALRRAWAARDAVMGRLVLVPVAAGVVVVGSVLLAVRAPAPSVTVGHRWFAGLVAVGIMATWGTVVAIRVGAHRADLPLGVLRWAVSVGLVAAVGISVGAAGLAGYGWVLRADDPGLFTSANGILATPLPFTILVAVSLGLVAAGTADRAAMRGLRSLRGTSQT